MFASKIVLSFFVLITVSNVFSKECVDYYGWQNTLTTTANATDTASDFLNKFIEATPLEEDVSFIGPGICKMTHVRSEGETEYDMVERAFDIGFGHNIVLGKKEGLVLLHQTNFPHGDQYCDRFFSEQKKWMSKFLEKSPENGYVGTYLNRGIYSLKIPHDHAVSLIRYFDNKTPTSFHLRFHHHTKSILLTQVLESRVLVCVFPNAGEGI
jgi:hypothetical protein